MCVYFRLYACMRRLDASVHSLYARVHQSDASINIYTRRWFAVHMAQSVTGALAASALLQAMQNHVTATQITHFPPT